MCIKKIYYTKMIHSQVSDKKVNKYVIINIDKGIKS